MRPFLVPPGSAPTPQRDAPTFSILIATYQAAETVVESVESALAQTTPALEVIVVDDGSTDDTREQLAPYLERIVYIRQENRGAPAASNVGCARARGDFVSILDADDAYDPRRLEALTELARARPDLDILMTDAVLEVDGEPVGRVFDWTPFVVDEQLTAIFEKCFIAWPAVRRSAFEAVGGFDETLPIGYDWECWIRMLHRGARAGAVGEPLMRYRIGSRRSLTDDRVAALRSRVRVLESAARLDLSEPERRALEVQLGRRRRFALLADTEHALRARRPGARRQSLEVALSRGMPLGTRLRGLAAALAPGIAAGYLEALETRTGHAYSRRRPPERRQ